MLQFRRTGPDPLMVRFDESSYSDRVLYKDDIAGSIVFARPNGKAGIITQEEYEKLEAGLCEVEKELEASSFNIVPGIELSLSNAAIKYFHIDSPLLAT
ncbi:hypothetical protein V8C34DRAFT_281141 [Trichoderma compactum]